jgi:hypothetical protein
VRRPLAALLVAAGCYSPDLTEGLPCSPDMRCPEGQRCGEDGRCWRQEPPRFDAAGPDARPDSLINPPARVSDTGGRSDAPSLVWTGSDYGVAWIDNQAGDDEVFFARVAADGTLLGEAVRVTESVGEAREPSLVWTGAGYAVAFADDTDGNFEIYLALLRDSGELDGAPIRITNDPEFSGSPWLTWTGNELVVLWNDGRDDNYEIYAARIDPAGRKIGGDLRVTNDAGFSATPCATWTGSELAVAWADDRDGNNEIYYNRLDQLGAPAGGDVRVTTSADAYSSSPHLAFTGDDLTVVWLELVDDREVYFERLALAGDGETAALPMSDPMAGTATSVSSAWTGDELAIVYAEDRAGDSDILLTRRDLAGVVTVPPAAVADGAEGSREAVLVWTGAVFAIAWADDRDGNFEIYLREIAP